MVYTPGVARVCRAIAADPEASFSLTIRRNTVAVVSDGSAVLGLGNIGPKAAMPVMEGKCMLFKEFGGVDAFPICLDTQDVDEIVRTVASPGADVRRHQPGGHLLAALRRDRAAADCAAGYSRVPRRSARHGRRGLGGAAQCVEDRRKAARRRARGDSRRGRGGRGHRQAAEVDGLPADRALRPQRRHRPQPRAPTATPSSNGSPKTPIPRESPARWRDAMRGADVFIGVSGPDL